MSDLNQVTLEAVIDHLQAGGETDINTLAGVVGVTARSTRVVQNYLDACAEEDVSLGNLTIGDPNPYADEAPEEEEEQETEDAQEEAEEEEPPAKVAPPTKKNYRFFFQRKDGTSIELQRVAAKSKGSVITFKEVTPSDIVKLMVKGEIVEVDLVPLRLLPPRDSSFVAGVSNEKLLLLALAAK